jgi:uncharacterized membrane protein
MKLTWKSELPLLAMIALAFGLTVFFWGRVPESIPVHFNFEGEPDRWGSRAEGLLVGPGVALGLYLLFLVLPRLDPGRRNYASFQGVYNVLRYGVIGLMLALHVLIIAYAMGAGLTMNVVVPLLVGLLMIVLGNLMGKIRPNWFVGIKTPWTLSSKRSWGRTHRLGGRLMVLLGVLIVLLGLIERPWVVWALTGLVAAYVIGLVAYSWAVWRRDPDPVPPAGSEPAEEA